MEVKFLDIYMYNFFKLCVHQVFVVCAFVYVDFVIHSIKPLAYKTDYFTTE